MNDIYQRDKETAWCPGCGNFPIRKALINALEELELTPDQVAMFTGIGQAAKMPHHIRINGFNGLHGRALPPAIGQRVANPNLKTIVASGDGDTYGEGGNHLLHNIRRNPDLAHLVHNNQIYGLTKGQASPTTEAEMKTTIQPNGITASSFNPIRFAIVMGASFVARAFSGNLKQTTEIIKKAINHPGYALVDILQPCVTFNKLNTYQWYKKRVYTLGDEHDFTQEDLALKKATEWGEKIPLGVIYKQEKPTFSERFPQLKQEETLVEQDLDSKVVKEFIEDFK